MTSNINNDNISVSSMHNINSNLNESKVSNIKKKDQLPQETFYNLCQDLLRFINRKIVKKYVFPNEAQLPKEKRGLELRADNNWKYYLNKEISEEEKIKDVFKDNYFLGTLQRMTNALNEVTDYIELNQKKINMINDKSKYKEERKNSLNELKNLIDNYLTKKDKEKGDNSDNNNNNKSDNEDSSSKNINEKINEKINELYKLQKYIEGVNMNKENFQKNEESSIKDETIPLFSNIESSDKIHPSSEKKQIDILFQNFRLEEKKDSEKNKIKEKSFTEKKENKKDDGNNNVFLNKKKEREGKEKNTKNKNKKKKTKNKEENIEKKEDNIDINDKNNNKIDAQINQANNPPIKFQTIPVLNPKKESININNIELKEKKKNVDINEEILQQLLNESKENSIKNNSEKKEKIPEKKEVINIESLANNNNSIKSNDEIFDSELKKYFSENQRDQRDKMNMIIKNIIYTLDNQKILGIKKYNDRIIGPYLAGSFRTFPDLYSIKYPREIDIIYKYKNMLLNKEAIDFSVKEVLGNYLGLNIIKSSDSSENENKVTKIEVECGNKMWENNNSIKFNVLFVDSTFGFNERIIDELIINKTVFLVKAEAEKFMNIGLFLRLWRKKSKCLYIIPEILDELVRKYICEGKTTLTIVLNVFFELYNKMPEFYLKNNNSDFVSKQKILCEEIMLTFFSKENDERIDEMKKKIMKEVQDINSKNFDEIFKM